MTRSGIPRPASIATLVEDPPEFNGNTSQDMLENDSKLAEAALDDDEKTALKNGDYEVSHHKAARKVADTGRWENFGLPACILINLVWPWLFFCIAYASKGIQMNDYLAKSVMEHPHSTNFVVTLIANLVCLLTSYLFSCAVIRFAQEWIAKSEIITVFDVSFISGLGHQALPWNFKEIKQLLVGKRAKHVSLVGICLSAFALIPSGVTSLITPVPFKKNAAFQVNEIDFSSNDPDCLDWLDKIQEPNCTSGNSIGCFANQLVDVLDSGRGNILSVISDNSQSVSFGQLGGSDGLRFLGPIRGVLPLGPNGVPAFDTPQPPPFSNSATVAGMISYNYTLEHQGLASAINCSYVDSTPITFHRRPDTNFALDYNGSCNGETDVLEHPYTTANGPNVLGYWACQSPPAAGPIYYLYLEGVTGTFTNTTDPGGIPPIPRALSASPNDGSGHYTGPTGLYPGPTSDLKLACTISPIQAAIYPVTYQSLPRIFSSTKSIANATQVYSRLIERSLIELGDIINDAQNFHVNLVAESVITVGARSFGLPRKGKHPKYLELYEWMIRGILEYEATYLRLIWSMADNRPPSCNRKVNGSVSYMVLGWSAVLVEVVFLMPMSLLNISALIIVIMAIGMARGDAEKHDPASVKSLLVAQVSRTDKLEWADTVRCRRGDYRTIEVGLQHSTLTRRLGSEETSVCHQCHG